MEKGPQEKSQTYSFFPGRSWVVPDVPQVFFAGNQETTGRREKGEKGDKESSVTTQSHAPHTHAHRGLLVRAGLSGKLDLKADNF